MGVVYKAERHRALPVGGPEVPARRPFDRRPASRSTALGKTCLVLGSHDYFFQVAEAELTLTPLVKEYFDKINAPLKEMVLILSPARLDVTGDPSKTTQWPESRTA